MKPFIKLDNVDFEYEEGNKVISNVNIEINSGDFIAIVGHNGCGKSTLSKLFNALLIPSNGNVFIDDINISDKINSFRVKCKVGLVQQNPDNQIVASTVEEDVAFGPENLGLDSKEIRDRVDDALRCVGMYEFKDKSTHKLSGGQKQKVAIAGIIAMQPKCIVLDEPTSMLDPRGRQDVLDTLVKLNKENNITIILITHYMQEATLADKVIVMDSGKILIQGTPKEVFSEVDLLKQHRLGIPQVTELVELLRDEGCNLPKGIIYEDEFINHITTLLEED